MNLRVYRFKVSLATDRWQTVFVPSLMWIGTKIIMLSGHMKLNKVRKFCKQLNCSQLEWLGIQCSSKKQKFDIYSCLLRSNTCLLWKGWGLIILCVHSFFTEVKKRVNSTIILDVKLPDGYNLESESGYTSVSNKVHQSVSHIVRA